MGIVGSIVERARLRWRVDSRRRHAIDRVGSSGALVRPRTRVPPLGLILIDRLIKDALGAPFEGLTSAPRRTGHLRTWISDANPVITDSPEGTLNPRTKIFDTESFSTELTHFTEEPLLVTFSVFSTENRYTLTLLTALPESTGDQRAAPYTFTLATEGLLGTHDPNAGIHHTLTIVDADFTIGASTSVAVVCNTLPSLDTDITSGAGGLTL